MRSFLSWLSFSCVFAFAAACGSTPGNAPTDGGTSPALDGGSSQDAGGPSLQDGGSSPSADGSAPSDAASARDAMLPPADGEAGVWVDVSPAALTALLPTTYGAGTVVVDPGNPQNVYTSFGQGIWMSTDYGSTWHGPIDVKVATSFPCTGYLRIPPSSTTASPTIFAGVPNGGGNCTGGFWKSVNGGVDWTNLPVNVTSAGSGFYAPAVDPYDPNHLLMAVHLQPMIVESTDGGQSWQSVTIDPGMVVSESVFAVAFIDTGVASSTRTTWLSLDSADGPGTWRTTNGGTTWTQVALTTHDPGASQIYQPPGALNYVFLGATYDFGRGLEGGVYMSDDFGVTWSRLGNSNDAKLVFGTTKAIYSMAGEVAQMGSQCSAASPCQAPLLQSAPQPGTGTWTSLITPDAMDEGPTWAAVTSDGVHNILLTANYGAGLWRYVEP